MQTKPISQTTINTQIQHEHQKKRYYINDSSLVQNTNRDRLEDSNQLLELRKFLYNKARRNNGLFPNNDHLGGALYYDKTKEQIAEREEWYKETDEHYADNKWKTKKYENPVKCDQKVVKNYISTKQTKYGKSYISYDVEKSLNNMMLNGIDRQSDITVGEIAKEASKWLADTASSTQGYLQSLQAYLFGKKQEVGELATPCIEFGPTNLNRQLSTPFEITSSNDDLNNNNNSVSSLRYTDISLLYQSPSSSSNLNPLKTAPDDSLRCSPLSLSSRSTPLTTYTDNEDEDDIPTERDDVNTLPKLVPTKFILTQYDPLLTEPSTFNPPTINFNKLNPAHSQFKSQSQVAAVKPQSKPTLKELLTLQIPTKKR
jgi:hypothetical protein